MAYDLNAMFNTGNPYLTLKGYDQLDTINAQSKQDLLTAIQKAQQEKDMHPLKMEQQRADTTNTLATARNSNANAATHEDALNVLQKVPMDKRVQNQMALYMKNVAEGDLAKIGADMQKAQKWAAKGLQGPLSLQDTITLQQEAPELLGYLKNPNGAKVLANMVTAFNSLNSDRQKSDSAHNISANASRDVARINADSRLGVEQLRLSMKKALTTAKDETDPYKRMVALAVARTNAELAGDHESAAAIDAHIKAIQPIAEIKGGGAQKPGTVDINALSQGKIPTKTVPQVSRDTSKPQTTPAAKPSQWKPPAGWSTN